MPFGLACEDVSFCGSVGLGVFVPAGLLVLSIGWLGVVDGVVPEPPGGAHRDHAAAAALLGGAVLDSLADLVPRDPERLLRERRDRFHRFGVADAGGIDTDAATQAGRGASS